MNSITIWHGRGACAWVACLLIAACVPCTGHGAEGEAATDELFAMSIEQLLEVDVTTVSRHDESLRTAAAAVYVITQEDIERSGARYIPELLRMVPGLHVARLDANKWAVASRGFNGRFARHLLVLMDGRTVYSPLFSGTFWEYQDTPLHDIARIEVIRGPGGTMWGANAVNAVINIITKRADTTQGHRAEAGAGTQSRRFGSYRYGGTLNDETFYRFYVKAHEHGPFARDGGADDQWRSQRVGFRMDWRPQGSERLTLQGDLFDTETGQGLLAFPIDEEDVQATGGNLLARWERDLAAGDRLSLQVYYDYLNREEVSIDEERHTLDFDAQHRLQLGTRHDVTWGVGFRVTRDNLRDSPNVRLLVADQDRTDRLYSLFAQDEIALVPELVELTLGAKFEHNDYTGAEIQPNVRLSYVPSDNHTLWAAASRAVRTPARLERTTQLTTVFSNGTLVQLETGRDFDSEILWAYEFGHRARLSKRLSLDTAFFYHDYEQLQSVDLVGAAIPPPYPPNPLPGTAGNPLVGEVGNGVYGETYGVETTARWQVRHWWRLVGSYAFARVCLHVDRGVNDITSEALFEEDHPRHQASLRSMMDLPNGIQFDTWLRFVDRIKTAEGDHFFDEVLELDARVRWQATPTLKFELVGRNLLDDRHGEYGSSVIYRTEATETERSAYVQMTWDY